MEPNLKSIIRVFQTLIQVFNGAGLKLILKRKLTLTMDLLIGDTA